MEATAPVPLEMNRKLSVAIKHGNKRGSKGGPAEVPKNNDRTGRSMAKKRPKNKPQ